ncbi:MAG TPA: hypothetical protein VER03_03345, partial [Bryobacteraceae bacterium]|nr:hypothetical protein [Bryobacteraceae bacterium]
YWFRYTCVLILRTRDVKKYAERVAQINHLTFLEAEQKLATVASPDETFEKLHESLDRDYRVVSYLLRNAGTQGGESIEEHMLRLDYQIMRVYYFLTKPFSRRSARHALIERASIISHLANAMGERVALL